MPKRRFGRDRAIAQGSRLGSSIKAARGIAGLTRDAAARRSGLARSTWDRIEAGTPSVTLATLTGATEAVGLDLVCQTYPGRGPSLRDSGQLGIAERLRSLASPMWLVSLEELAGEHGEAIDMVFRGPSEVLAVEIERLMLDWQGQYRRASIKRVWLAEHTALPVRLVFVIEDISAQSSHDDESHGPDQDGHADRFARRVRARSVRENPSALTGCAGSGVRETDRRARPIDEARLRMKLAAYRLRPDR